MAGRNRWHWSFQTKTASYHIIARNRQSGSVIEEFLNGAVPEVWQSDAYAPQLRAPAKTGQLCLAHQWRELTRAAELEPDAAWWAQELRHLFGRGMRLHAERGEISAESFQRRRVRIINAAERSIKGPPLGKGMAGRLQQHYQRLWSELFVFLERDGVEPTNNASERDLRNSVIHRCQFAPHVGSPALLVTRRRVRPDRSGRSRAWSLSARMCDALVMCRDGFVIRSGRGCAGDRFVREVPAMPDLVPMVLIRCIRLVDEQVLLDAEGSASTANCPSCGTVSARVHGRYQRRPADLPWRGRVRPVALDRAPLPL
ncbi:MAG: transposase [Chloroflexota bacterium]